ncbi:hypothetical protein LCGC14_1107040 [marine sediment metagenome]|uniref:Uncharacterized protein n=1 Tax=marine sediment metagenome TaxID=412755 RepID=A0A0F9MVR7_9ZZZZ
MEEPRNAKPRETPESGALDFLEKEKEDEQERKRFGSRFSFNFSHLILPMLISVGITVVLVSQFAADKQRFNALVGEVGDLSQLVQAMGRNIELRIESLDYIDGGFLTSEFDSLERKVAFLELEISRLK